MNEIVEAMVVAFLARSLPSLDRLLGQSNDPFADRVRNFKPVVWPSEIAEKEIKEKDQ